MTVALDHLSKRFATITALDDVTLDIAQGELMAILGPSGCGKTTLLRLVAGLEQASSGRVLIGSRDVTAEPPQRRSIGMVFQSYALFPNLTVRQNVAFPLEVRGVDRRAVETRVAELLTIVNLRAEADRYPHQISGGQAQRCALARALAPRPDVLLLDEPLSALDVLVRVRLRDEIRRIQKQVGTTALYVTHDQGEALAIADRVAVMNAGRFEQVANPDDIYSRPQTAFCAAFVGSRNAIVLPVVNSKIGLGPGLTLPTPTIATATAQVFIAPEDVTIVESDAGGTPATVAGRTFHGPITRLQLDCQGDDGAVTLSADMASRDAVKIIDGQLVGVRIRAEGVICFAMSESQSQIGES